MQTPLSVKRNMTCYSNSITFVKTCNGNQPHVRFTVYYSLFPQMLYYLKHAPFDAGYLQIFLVDDAVLSNVMCNGNSSRHLHFQEICRT